MRHCKVLVIGENPYELMSLYDRNAKVEPYIARTSAEVIETWREYLKGVTVSRSLTQAFFTWGIGRTMDSFAQAYYGNSEFDQAGNLISRDNPKGKWTWHILGGRFRGRLIPKKDAPGVLGSPGMHGNKPEREDGVDRIRFGDVNWQKTNYGWLFANELTARWWNVLHGGTNINFEYYMRKYKTREEYVSRNMLFASHKVVTPDGKWHECGDSMEAMRDWEKNFWTKFMKDLSLDTLLTVVDCYMKES